MQWMNHLFAMPKYKIICTGASAMPLNDVDNSYTVDLSGSL